jgi:hypothetical protein
LGRVSGLLATFHQSSGGVPAMSRKVLALSERGGRQSILARYSSKELFSASQLISIYTTKYLIVHLFYTKSLFVSSGIDSAISQTSFRLESAIAHIFDARMYQMITCGPS